jgi:hypothetical protein
MAAVRSGMAALVLISGVLAATAAVRADAIQKWRTPAGSLYFGDHAPTGSVLLETIADTPAASAPTAAENDLARAAADGREIIRRRSAERAEERRLDAARAAELDALEASEPSDGLPFLVIDTFPRCGFGVPCPRRGVDRFGHAPGYAHGRRRGEHLPYLRPVLRVPVLRPAPPRGGRLMGTGRSPRERAG